MILFVEASLDQLWIIPQVLERFCNASGLKVSIAKTTIHFSKNVDVVLRKDICGFFGFQEVSDLGKYLGVSILHKRVTKATYRFLIQKVQDKLSGWKTKSLSLAGRIVLAKVVLAAIPPYVMRTAWLPKNVCVEIERIIQLFIWCSIETERGVHLVGWDDLCLPHHHGLLRAKYKWRGVNVDWPSVRRCSQIWKGMSFVWHDVHRNLVWNIGDGSKARFWLDAWIGNRDPIVAYLAHDQVHWDILFGSFLWCVWKKRNEWIFGDSDRYSESVLQRAVHNEEETWLTGFSRKLGICSILEVELWGLYEGLVTVWSIGIRFLLIELDCLEAVNLIAKRDSLLVVPSIIYYIAELLNRAWSVKLCHIGRNGNGVADWMAKYVDFDDFICHRFLSPPVEVEVLLIREATH
ncbi:hypothetical protein GQ457_16G011850 [Hibiscus cannabinus]